jgi:hypothetical protein
VRLIKSRGGGPRGKDRVDFLNGLLYCVCGQKLWSEGASGGKQRKRHRSPCAEWGVTERLYAERWEVPIKAQLSGLDLAPGTIARVARAFAEPPIVPNVFAVKRIERERRLLAERYATGTVTEAQLIAEGQRLKAQLDALTLAPVPSGVTSGQAIVYMRDLCLYVGRRWRAGAVGPGPCDL